MATHIDKQGQFQSDKYPTCPPGKFPLSFKDVRAQPLIWMYSEITQDEELSRDLKKCLALEGYEKPQERGPLEMRWDLLAVILGYNELAKRTEYSFETRVWMRMVREQATLEYVRMGGNLDITNEGEFLNLSPGVPPGRPLFKKTEIEDIRAFLAKYDADMTAEDDPVGAAQKSMAKRAEWCKGRDAVLVAMEELRGNYIYQTQEWTVLNEAIKLTGGLEPEADK